MNLSNITYISNDPITCDHLIQEAYIKGTQYIDLIKQRQFISILGIFTISLFVLILLERSYKKLKKDPNQVDIEKLTIQLNYLLVFLYYQMIFFLFMFISKFMF